VLTRSLGADYATHFSAFERVPFAAASIGQVHAATLAASASPTGREERVAVKVQFPNVAASIASDLGYVKLALTAGRLLPKGLFLDRTLEVMQGELADECDYTREAAFIRRFGAGLAGDARFRVPWVWAGSTRDVLVMEHVRGTPLNSPGVLALPQAERDEVRRPACAQTGR
jgi:aarF domain-containing kinase